jgi:tetratricopeptide (TPR) repeat protein
MPTIAELYAQAVKLHQAGEIRQAEQMYRQVYAADNRHADAVHQIGLIAYQLGDFAAADQLIRLALGINSRAAAYHCNLGLVSEALGKPAEAMRCYEQALRLNPNLAEAQVGLGNTLLARDRIADAEVHFRQATQLRPGFPEAHNNLGNVLVRQGRFAEAAAAYEEALTLRPNYLQAHSNLGHALKELGRFDEAMAHLEEALRLQPDNADAHWNRALLWLLRGDFERGWPEYEWRWPAHRLQPRAFKEPRWDGGRLDGRTILLHGEQGLGDTLQFIRYAPLVHERGGKVIVECHAALVRLVQKVTGVERALPPNSELPAFDVYAPLLSLPGILHTTLATVPAKVPYLDADLALVEKWRSELTALGSFKIGIAWQGNPAFAGERQRTVPLEHFAALAAVPGVRLISLQKGPGAEQLQKRTDRVPVLDLGPRLDETAGPFQDTAAIMQCLDLVVSSDTAIPHLAGALGVPVWVALPHVPDWRWLLGRDDSPWYPTMRLFRQSRPGDWEGVFKQIAADVRSLAAGYNQR